MMFERYCDFVPCVDCGKMGYTDQRTKTDLGYLCTRCSNPHIDWVAFDSQYKKLKPNV